MIICFGCIELAGLAVVALAIWMLLDPMFYASMGQDGQSYYTGVYIFLAVGVLMFIVGILGYCGDSRESPCLLLLYCCAMVIIIVSEVVAVVWAYRNRVQIEEYVRETIKITVQKEYGVLSSRTKAFDAIQEGLQCCGVNGPKDWAGSEYNMRDRGAVNLAVSSFLHVYKIPRSCCRAGLDDDICNIALRVGLGAQIVDAIYPEGCVDKVIKALKNHVNILLGIGISIVVLECLALIFSLVRCCSIRDVNKV